MAGNQLGKSLSASAESAMHSTGLYPDWWEGRRIPKHNRAWVASPTSLTTRDTAQRLLLGLPGQYGTGYIPKEKILDVKNARGVPDAVDRVDILHADYDVSYIYFKSYEQGREKWQAETIDYIWFDEEPPPEIYTEGLTRTNATHGFVFMTFTPLLGMSQVVHRFLMEPSPDRDVTRMDISDALHYTEEQRNQIINSYPVHEREARAHGVPMLGSGKVFPIAEEVIFVEPFKIPDAWPKIVGLDFGWEHPTAAAWLAWNRDTDTIYIYDTYRVKEQTPLFHAASIKSKGDYPVAWPHDGLQHDKGSGQTLRDMYAKHGLKMLPDRATFEDGSNGLEAGIAQMLERMQTGRFKVFNHLSDWRDEFRQYHRKDGLIVKLNDDIMSATRYAMMMLRHASSKTTAFDYRAFYNR
jgi:phage terminase large subunit-like protein